MFNDNQAVPWPTLPRALIDLFMNRYLDYYVGYRVCWFELFNNGYTVYDPGTLVFEQAEQTIRTYFSETAWTVGTETNPRVRDVVIDGFDQDWLDVRAYGYLGGWRSFVQAHPDDTDLPGAADWTDTLGYVTALWVAWHMHVLLVSRQGVEVRYKGALAELRPGSDIVP